MTTRLGRRKFLIYGSMALGTSIFLKACGGGEQTPTASPSATTSPTASGEGIKVGILHSLSGTMAISETSVVEATELAIEEINAAGGVLGKQIVPIKEDGASDWPTFAEKATKLIDEDKVVTVFGCWTSASRKAVLPVFESKNICFGILSNMKVRNVLLIFSTPGRHRINRLNLLSIGYSKIKAKSSF
jgi:urea transport system substrate-binding protein